MKVNLLEQFKSNVHRLKFNSQIKDSFCFQDEQVDFAIKILTDFFPANYFIIDQKLTHIDDSGLNANNNWIIFHLCQTATSFGSILIIFEITCIVYYFSSTEYNKQLLWKKFKTNNGNINEPEFRSSYFELYIAAILEKAGFKISIDEQSNPRKPLDLIIKTNKNNILIECQTLKETLVEQTLTELLSFCSNSYLNLFEKNKNNFKRLQYLQVSLFVIIKNKQKIEVAKNKFKDLLKKYQMDILDASEGITHVNIPYTLSNEDYLVNIEPYKQGLFEAFSGLIEKKIGLKFQTYLRSNNQSYEMIQNIETNFPAKTIEERILKAFDQKKNQHKGSLYKDKIFIFEYENYAGIREAVNVDSISKNRLKGKLKSNEIVLIIIKDSRRQDNIIRNKLVISKDESSPIFKKLDKMNLNPFIEIV